MRNAATWAPSLETLEDRLTPSLNYNFSGGNLSVTGNTANATVTVWRGSSAGAMG